MGARDPTVLLAPEKKGDEIIVSKKKLDELLRQKDREIERLRKETVELRRRLQVQENLDIPPSVGHNAPGYARERALVPPNERKRPGTRPGHEEVTRAPPTPDREIALTADTCTNCRGDRLKHRGTETELEAEVLRQRVGSDYAMAVYDFLDCGETMRARLPSGRAPSGYGPQLQSEIVLGTIEERLAYRKLAVRLERDRVPVCPATLQGVVGGARERQLAELVERFGRSWAGSMRMVVVTSLDNGGAWWLTFLRRAGVEPTNNRAERSIREAVGIRKIVGTLRNSKGAEALTRLLSVLGTWKLRRESPPSNLSAVLSWPRPLSALNTYSDSTRIALSGLDPLRNS